MPHVMPQVVLAVLAAFCAIRLEEAGINPLTGTASAIDQLGFLLCFLTVFKVQEADKQFWMALGHRDQLMQTCRYLALSSCAMFKLPRETQEKWQHDPAKVKQLENFAEQGLLRVLRLLSLQLFVALEYFGRSGPSATDDAERQDFMRDDIRSIATPAEMQRLYPDEDCPTADGSKCIKNLFANHHSVILWIQMAAERLHAAGACNPAVLSIFNSQLSSIMENVQAMDKIDKTQFPLPYAQIVKILMFLYVFTLPFQVVAQCGHYTIFISALAALGFYGLDEVAEILESPFGSDPNDIDLRVDFLVLMKDMRTCYRERAAVLQDFDATWNLAEKCWNVSLNEDSLDTWNDVETANTARSWPCRCASGEDTFLERARLLQPGVTEEIRITARGS